MVAFASYLFMVPAAIFAQLEYIPDVRVEIADSRNIPGVFIFNTIDNHVRFGAPSRYPSTVQIIHPLRPFPPIFFANIPLEGMDTGLFQDARFHPAAGTFSFFRKSGKTGGAYYVSDTGFVIRDTFAANGRIDGHAFEINAQGEYLYMTVTDTVLNLAAFCGNASDTAVTVLTQLIQIADKKGRVVFTWNPLMHLPFSDTYLPCYDIQATGSMEKGWNWSHANSLRFALDGNILYSFRHLGAGKINRHTGRVMWKLGGKTPTIPVPQGGEYYDQHDFHETAPGVYSIFSCGDEDHPSRAILYRIDEHTFTAEIMKIVTPSAAVYTLGTGNYEISDDGLCVFSYGRYACMEERQRLFEISDTSGRLLAAYSAPCLNSSFQVHRIQHWVPAQPGIINDSGTLSLSGSHAAVCWYEIDGSRAVHLGNGGTFRPVKKGVYVATAPKGFGWIVSKPYNF